MKKYLKDLYIRKDLILYLVTSGLKAQNKNSFLGYFWWLLDPFLNVLLYYFVVVVIFKRADGENYGIYLVVGLIIWRWLHSTISAASRSITSQGGIISQVYLPKGIFPLGASIAQLINFGFGVIVIFLFLIYFGVHPGFKIFWLPLIVFVQLVFMTTIAYLVAYICVFVRDFTNIIEHILRIWFFGSPIIWYDSMIPDKARLLLEINPMYHFLVSYRNIFIYNSNPEYLALICIGVGSIIINIVMIYFYYRYEYKIIKAL